jgi:hypothetical protein
MVYVTRRPKTEARNVLDGLLVGLVECTRMQAQYVLVLTSSSSAEYEQRSRPEDISRLDRLPHLGPSRCHKYGQQPCFSRLSLFYDRALDGQRPQSHS